ncbi:MAG: methyl-accepting chemotaxis protein [Armatimonadetes bacterium]|nr:methyl-accepting chemotaxis protein [Armatimonadota bacterium]
MRRLAEKLRNLSLLGRLRLILFLLILAVFSLFGTWLYHITQGQILKETVGQYRQYGSLAGGTIFRNYKMTDSRGIQSFILALKGRDPEIFEISVISRSGEIVADLDEKRIFEKIRFKEERFLADALTGKPQLRQIRKGAGKALEGAFPLAEEGMKPAGVLLFKTHLSILERLKKQFATNTLASAFVILAVLLLVSGPVLRKTFTDRVTQIVQALTRIAGGDLTQELPSNSTDEIGTICKSVNDTSMNLRGTIMAIDEVLAQVSSFSRDLFEALENQAASTTEQSTAVAETATSTEELTRTSQNVSASADKVVVVAEETLATTRQGTVAIENVAEKIQQIGDQNNVNLDKLSTLKKQFSMIDEVVNFITEVAYQTRLIAFNATLQAAEAGEAGRTFGVVAREIRGLAENVAGYAREIRSHIKEIQDSANELAVATESTTRRIVEGQLSNEEARQAFDSVVSEIEKTTEAARYISLSSQQQLTASEQVLIAIQDVSQGAKFIVETTKNARNSVGRLLEFAENVKELVSTFKL